MTKAKNDPLAGGTLGAGNQIGRTVEFFVDRRVRLLHPSRAEAKWEIPTYCSTGDLHWGVAESWRVQMSGILKFAAWPVVAVIALFMFGPSLMNQLDSGNVKKLKIGMLEIDMSEAESLSLSDPDIAEGLAGLSETSIVSLLFAEPKFGYHQCANDGKSQELEEEYGVPFRDLESRGFVTSSETSEGGEKCFGIDLTDDGTVARQFLLDLIAAQLGAATAK